MKYEKITSIRIPRKNNLEFYGAIYNVASYCGLSRPFLNQKGKFTWQHGWKPSYFNINPKIVIGYDELDPKSVHLVARVDQKVFLQEHGYQNVHAVGLPICYVPDVKYERVPNSLLVMPPHSLESMNHNRLNFKEYVSLISDLKDTFSEIVVCVHPICLKKGYWVEDFKSVGIPVIEGADSFDRNALLRLQYLFSRFEFVTTNCFGSHIAYAALFGAKVSFYGNFFERKREDYDYNGVKFYQKNPEIHTTVLDLISENVTKQMLPDFFSHPLKAIERIQWGEKEVGRDQKLSQDELKDLFNWSRPEILQFRVTSAFEQIIKGAKSVVKKVSN